MSVSRSYHLETAIGPPGGDGELRCGPPRTACPGVVEQPPPGTFHYSVLGAPALTDADVDRSRVRRGVDPATGASVVVVGLTADGRERVRPADKGGGTRRRPGSGLAPRRRGGGRGDRRVPRDRLRRPSRRDRGLARAPDRGGRPRRRRQADEADRRAAECDRRCYAPIIERGGSVGGLDDLLKGATAAAREEAGSATCWAGSSAAARAEAHCRAAGWAATRCCGCCSRWWPRC